MCFLPERMSELIICFLKMRCVVKNLSLRLLSVSFFFIFFSVHSLPVHFDNSVEARYIRKQIALQEDAEYLMEALERGDVAAYHKRRLDRSKRDMKKIVTFVNGNGDNILHFLVRLEQFEDVKGYALDRLLIGEMKYIRSLGAWQFIRLLIKKNEQGIAPVQEAAASKQVSESTDTWRSKLSVHLSDAIASTLLDGSVSIPSRNRGLAYRAVEVAVESYKWPWRTVFDALVLVVPPAVTTGVVTYASNGDMTLLGIGGAVTLSACAIIFKRLSNLREARHPLSVP